ncbi:energy-coupling factor transporter transmembrane protein EcfT [Paenibacillus sp. DS2015]|uniref:energy-coupling factor transporter transmembrane component T n=1 Tax=Paenibacillus sp. DS2015 TaxID=3373917 RepID=UPI003D243B94
MPPQETLPQHGGAPWPEPHEVAAVIAAELARPARVLEQSRAEINKVDESKVADQQPPSSDMETSPSLSNEQKCGTRYDPRALVMMYLLLTAGVLAQRSFLQLLITAVIIAALLTPFRALIRPWMRVIRAYVIIIVVFCIFSGVSFQPFDVDWEKTLPTALRLSKLLLVMLLGMPLLKLMTPLRLQRAIEQTFGWLSRFKLPIYSFALLVTLIFRFIPLLTGEWERFAKLAHARGKAVTPLRSVPIRTIRSVIIPYVRSILRLAEQMADALEARGFGYTKRKPSFGFRLRFGRSDAVLISVSVLCSLLLFLLPAVL